MPSAIKKELQSHADKECAELLSRYFKTGKGEYGEGDVFLGIKVGPQRSIAKKYRDLTLDELQELLSSNIHEYRLVSLFILIDKYKRSDDVGKKEIVDFYLENTKNINNWDLIDLSSGKILGNYFMERNKSVLFKLAKSNILWERRIAIMATSEFIRNNKFDDTLKISEILLNDKHDLIHKAVGWMLREIGKRNQALEEKFLKKYYKRMSRTMLRYAIEKFDEEKRRFYLGK